MTVRSEPALLSGRQPLIERLEVHGRQLWPAALLLVVGALVLWPLAALVYGALRSDTPGAPDAVFTFENLSAVYLGLFGGWTGEAAFNSIALAVPVTLIATTIGVLLAWAVSRTDMPGRRVFEILFLVPMLYSPLVGVIGWTVLADPRAGLLNQWWKAATGAGTPIVNVYSWLGIVWVMVFYFILYAFVMNVGTFRSMDPAPICGGGSPASPCRSCRRASGRRRCSSSRWGWSSSRYPGSWGRIFGSIPWPMRSTSAPTPTRTTCQERRRPAPCCWAWRRWDSISTAA